MYVTGFLKAAEACFNIVSSNLDTMDPLLHRFRALTTLPDEHRTQAVVQVNQMVDNTSRHHNFTDRSKAMLLSNDDGDDDDDDDREGSDDDNDDDDGDDDDDDDDSDGRRGSVGLNLPPAFGTSLTQRLVQTGAGNLKAGSGGDVGMQSGPLQSTPSNLAMPLMKASTPLLPGRGYSLRRISVSSDIDSSMDAGGAGEAGMHHDNGK
jgi:hypothetical protein